MDSEDRISLLPDCLIIEIISRLPTTKEAIKTSTLSKRWKYVWAHVPNLEFIRPLGDDLSVSDFFSIVDLTLTQCSHSQSNLIKFHLHTPYNIQFESQVDSYIRYALKRNVQDLNLAFLTGSDFELHHDIFFSNSCFTKLSVLGCQFIPSGAISWTKLITLRIVCGTNLNEDLIANILSGTPLLENLVLEDCCGFKRIDITSKSVKNLWLRGYWNSDIEDDIIEINAPYIVFLAIQDEMRLRKLSLVNVSSLVKACINYRRCYSLGAPCNEADVEMFEGLLLSLRHVKRVEIGKACAEVFSCWEPEFSTFPLNLIVDNIYDSDSGSDETQGSEETEGSDENSNFNIIRL